MAYACPRVLLFTHPPTHHATQPTHPSNSPNPPTHPPIGITSVETSVEEKKVVVVSDGKVSPETMLAALKKWGEAAGKDVSLV